MRFFVDFFSSQGWLSKGRKDRTRNGICKSGRTSINQGALSSFKVEAALAYLRTTEERVHKGVQRSPFLARRRWLQVRRNHTANTSTRIYS